MLKSVAIIWCDKRDLVDVKYGDYKTVLLVCNQSDLDFYAQYVLRADNVYLLVNTLHIDYLQCIGLASTFLRYVVKASIGNEAYCYKVSTFVQSSAVISNIFDLNLQGVNFTKIDNAFNGKMYQVDYNKNVTFRPWGSYTELAGGDLNGFKVKEISVLPQAALSLQYHHHRQEHWIVLEGIATIQLDDNVFERKVGEEIFIPLGAKHRLQNKSLSLLRIIEVQVGSYLGEDDIVRLEDIYGRVK